MSLSVGSRLAHYDVTALIGEGGMGEVYRATDTKLNRQVLAPDRLARFQDGIRTIPVLPDEALAPKPWKRRMSRGSSTVCGRS